MEESGGNLWREIWRKKWRGVERKIIKSQILVSDYLNKTTILTMKGDSQDSQKWREGGGNMEETLCRWRKVEETRGGKYGGNSGGEWREKGKRNILLTLLL